MYMRDTLPSAVSSAPGEAELSLGSLQGRYLLTRISPWLQQGQKHAPYYRHAWIWAEGKAALYSVRQKYSPPG